MLSKKCKVFGKRRGALEFTGQPFDGPGIYPPLWA